MATGKTVIDGAVYYLGGETDGRMKSRLGEAGGKRFQSRSLRKLALF